jgi:hypothetical protein
MELPDLLPHLKVLNPFLLKVNLLLVLCLFLASLTYYKILELLLAMQCSAYVLQHWYPLECICATALVSTGVHLVISVVV